MSRPARLLRTIGLIPASQLRARARFLVLRRRYARSPERPVMAAREAAAGARARDDLPQMPPLALAPDGPDVVRERASLYAAGTFRYLRSEAVYGASVRWDAPGQSPLWEYQLQYLGAVLDLAVADDVAAAAQLLESWSDACGARWDRAAWHPYPVSVRIVNVCLAASAAGSFAALHADSAATVATQVAYLLEHLEHDVRGNHLLENACALLIAGGALEGELARHADRVGREIVTVEVAEQVLADGGHFELSPMYQCLVLQRLQHVAFWLGDADPLVETVLGPAIARMAAFLAGVLCPDGDIPLFGDAVRRFAPPPAALLELSRPFGFEPTTPRPFHAFQATGLHVWRTERIYATLDAGACCPTYLPAHGQADALTVEVWIDGACVVGDPGVYDYTGPERDFGRSSRAHSTVTVDDANDSEVYGSFRVGGRVHVGPVDVIAGVDAGAAGVAATIRPWTGGAQITRRVDLGSDAEGALTLCDEVVGASGGIARSRLHLHPAVRVDEVEDGGRVVVLATPAGRVCVTAEHPVELEISRASRELGLKEETTMLVQRLAPSEGDARTLRGRFTIAPHSCGRSG